MKEEVLMNSHIKLMVDVATFDKLMFTVSLKQTLINSVYILMALTRNYQTLISMIQP